MLDADIGLPALIGDAKVPWPSLFGDRRLLRQRDITIIIILQSHLRSGNRLSRGRIGYL